MAQRSSGAPWARAIAASTAVGRPAWGAKKGPRSTCFEGQKGHSTNELFGHEGKSDGEIVIDELVAEFCRIKK